MVDAVWPEWRPIDLATGMMAVRTTFVDGKPCHERIDPRDMYLAPETPPSPTSGGE